MIGTIFIDGRRSDGLIPVTDSSVLRGDGCFEVLKSYRGRAFGIDEHLDRLEASARALDIPLPDRSDVTEWIEECAAELGDCVVRVVITRGAAVPDVDDPARAIVFAHSLSGYESATTLLPVVAPWHAAGVDWDLAGAKLLSYAPNLAATRRAEWEGFGDALLLTTDGVVLEGPTFSVAWVVDGVVETPTLDLGILDSITRRVVLESASEGGIDLVEGSWRHDRLSAASEVMILSTVREVQAVTAVGEMTFEEGPITKQLATAFLDRVTGN